MYFIVIDCLYAREIGLKQHFRDPWNQLTIVPPILIMAAEYLIKRTVRLAALDEEGDYSKTFKNIRIMYAFTILLIWIRFMYFFRIFK